VFDHFAICGGSNFWAFWFGRAVYSAVNTLINTYGGYCSPGNVEHLWGSAMQLSLWNQISDVLLDWRERLLARSYPSLSQKANCNTMKNKQYRK
jgi:hypothetical protein